MNTLLNIQSISLVCLVPAIAFFARSVHASPRQEAQSDFNAVDEYIKTEMKRLGIPGMALGIVEDNEPVHLQGFGIADSAGRSVTPQTPFYIGSVTKSFTALAIMQLVEAGRIELDAPVQQYIPWFELADKEAAAKITVRNLLNQTTGISEKVGNSVWSSQKGVEEFVRDHKTTSVTHSVGTKYEYSNFNYTTAGLVIEKVTGQSYAEYIAQHILEPLDMRHSYTSRELALADDLSEGHYYRFGHAFAGVGPLPPADLPSGLLMSSIEDMTHYVIVHLNDGQYRDKSILSPQGIAELHAPGLPMKNPDLHYAMGWAVGSFDGMPLIRHSGDTAYFHSMVILLPENDLGIILLANASGFEQLQQIDEIAMNVAGMLNGKSSPDRVALPFMLRTLYWGVLLIPLLQLFGIGRGLVHWQNGVASAPWQVIVTMILNLAIAFFFFLRIPNLTSMSISSMRVFYPELAYGLMTGGTLGLVWSIIYPILNFFTRK